jgi:Fanconi anemia group M protein
MKRKQKAKNEIIIYADNREGNRISHIIEKKFKCKIEDKQLEVADYLLSEDVAVERKTIDDFLNSIVDGRLFNQLSELKSNFEKPILILEGENLFDDLSKKRKVHPNAILGAIASIATDFSVPILWTKNQIETAAMLFAIAKREQIDNKKSISVRGKRKFKSMNQRQEFLLCGLPKINTTTAKKLLEHFKTPEKIFIANEKELQNVDGIGKEMAKKIREILTKEYEKSILED